MSLQYIILGLLKNAGSLSGYDLKQIIDRSTSNFWYCDLSQIYRALNAIEKAEWVTSTANESNKRHRITYSLTEQGEIALQNWLEEDIEYDLIRQPELARFFFGKYIPPERLRQQLIAHRTHAESRLSRYLQIKAEIESSRNKAPEDVPYWIMTVQRGILDTKASIEWCDDALEQLEKLAQQAKRTQGESCR